MKTAFFNSAKKWGGGEKWHYEVSEALHAKGWETILFTNKKSQLFYRLIESKQNVYTIKVSNLSFLNPLKLIKISRWFIQEKIETIIINLPADLKIAGIAARIAGVKRIVYRRGSAIPIKNSLFNRIIFKYLITDVLANSEETKKTILQKNKSLFIAEKIKVIYNGLDFSKYGQQTEISGKKSNKIVIGNLGRMVKQKGQHYLIDLASELKKREMHAQIIIGGDGPLRNELSDLASKQNVSQIVHFPGFIIDIQTFMTSIDIFVLTSLWEGFGYVIAEAMYYKKPVIAFNISSNSEFIKNGENGFLVKMGDTEAMAERINYLHVNQSELKQMGTNGHEYVTRNLSLDNTINQLVDFLNS